MAKKLEELTKEIAKVKLEELLKKSTESLSDKDQSIFTKRVIDGLK